MQQNNKKHCHIGETFLEGFNYVHVHYPLTFLEEWKQQGSNLLLFIFFYFVCFLHWPSSTEKVEPLRTLIN
jgi:hypothetical protein